MELPTSNYWLGPPWLPALIALVPSWAVFVLRTSSQPTSLPPSMIGGRQPTLIQEQPRSVSPKNWQSSLMFTRHASRPCRVPFVGMRNLSWRTRKTNDPRVVGRPRSGKDNRMRRKYGVDTPDNMCKRENVISVRAGTQRNSALGDEHKPPIVPSKPFSNGLVRFKSSKLWAGNLSSREEMKSVPFIDHLGFIHSSAICLWKCDSRQLLATIASTVFKRLKGRVRKLPFHARPKPNLLFRAALVYSLTLNTYWFKRFSELLIRNSKNLKNHLYYGISNMDYNKRLLFDQASMNALWLQSRVRKCTLRVMSNIDMNLKPSATPIGESVVSRANKCLSDWGSVFAVPFSQTRSCMIDSRPDLLFGRPVR